MKKLSYPLLMCAATAVVLLFSGCTRQARKARYVAKADRYFAAGQYEAAEIEYMNAARLDRNDPHVVGRLGVIFFDEGRVGNCYVLLTMGKQLAPDNLDVRLDLGLYLLAVGKLDAAKDEALYILERKPESEEAPLLLAESATQIRDMEAARRRLEQLPVAIRNGAPVLVALGNLQFRQKHLDDAEALFRRALQANPRFANAYTGLAALSWLRKDATKAGEYFAKAAELSAIRSAKRLQYAQFKIRTGDVAGGRQILEDIATQAPDFLPPNMQLAELDERDGKFDQAEAAVTKVLNRDPLYPDAMLVSGRLKLARNEPAKALVIFEKARDYFPRNPILQYELAQAYLGTHATEKAEATLNLTIAMAPDFAEPVVALANIQLQKGNLREAVVTLKQLVERRPDFLQAKMMLAGAYADLGDADDALALYRQIAAGAPNLPQPLTLAGAVLLQQKKPVEARAAFEQALRLDPSYAPALDRLVDLDLMERRYAEARALVESRIAKAPKQAAGYVLLARVYLAQGEMKPGEAALKKAIELQPDLNESYFLLAELYFTTKQDKQALADLQKVVANNPKDTQALMLMGTISIQENDFTAARATYERTLAADPDFSPALNNLAYLYTENFGEFEKAFVLAQRARKLLPNEPQTADTLGWVLYHKRQFTWALSLLQEAAAGLPKDAETLYHLGMTQYMLAQDDAARLTLQHALAAGGSFPGADDARRRLAVLTASGAMAGASAKATLEREAADHVDDPIVLGRLAAIYEQEGAVDKAIAVCESALKLGPNDVAALARLARLLQSQGKTAKAFEFAKSAHNLAPDDPVASHVLGRLAFQTGDYAWAASLLGDVAASQPHDADVLFDLGEAQYSLGRVADAEGCMRRALEADAAFKRAGLARRFLQLTAIADQPADAAANVGQADRVLVSEPSDVPALMAKGLALKANGDATGATREFEAALARFPRFAPAERQLVLLYAERSDSGPKIYDVANKAREAFPDDPAVAKACGVIAYRRGDYLRTKNLMDETVRRTGDDGEVLFYLGMAQLHLKDKVGKISLERALGLKLRPDLAAEAKRALSELKS